MAINQFRSVQFVWSTNKMSAEDFAAVNHAHASKDLDTVRATLKAGSNTTRDMVWKMRRAVLIGFLQEVSTMTWAVFWSSRVFLLFGVSCVVRLKKRQWLPLPRRLDDRCMLGSSYFHWSVVPMRTRLRRTEIIFIFVGGSLPMGGKMALYHPWRTGLIRSRPCTPHHTPPRTATTLIRYLPPLWSSYRTVLTIEMPEIWKNCEGWRCRSVGG